MIIHEFPNIPDVSENCTYDDLIENYFEENEQAELKDAIQEIEEAVKQALKLKVQRNKTATTIYTQ